MVEVKNFHFLKRPFLTKKGKWFFVTLRGGGGGLEQVWHLSQKKCFFLMKASLTVTRYRWISWYKTETRTRSGDMTWGSEAGVSGGDILMGVCQLSPDSTESVHPNQQRVHCCTARSATTWETWQWRVDKNLRTRARLRKFLDSSCYQSGDSPLQQRSLQLQLQRVSPGQIVSTLLISKQSHNPLQSLVHTFWSRLQNFADGSYAALVPTLINGLCL